MLRSKQLTKFQGIRPAESYSDNIQTMGASCFLTYLLYHLAYISNWLVENLKTKFNIAKACKKQMSETYCFLEQICCLFVRLSNCLKKLVETDENSNVLSTIVASAQPLLNTFVALLSPTTTTHPPCWCW